MKSRTIPSANYAVGSTTVDIPVSAQKKFIGGTMTFTREDWPAGTDWTLSDGHVATNVALVVSFERSLNGTDWLKVGSWTFVGGVQLKRDGSVRLTDNQSFSFSDVMDGDLRVIFNRLVALRTAVTVTMLEPGD